MALGHGVSCRSVHPPAFRLLPPIGDDQKLVFPTAVRGPSRVPALCIPPTPCIPYPCSPVGSCPARDVLCPGRERILPSLWLHPGHLSPALTVLGVSLSPVCPLGRCCGHYLNRPNCEGILHSSVPVSSIQHYCVLGKGVGAKCPSPTPLYHCVITFSTHTVYSKKGFAKVF